MAAKLYSSPHLGNLPNRQHFSINDSHDNFLNPKYSKKIAVNIHIKKSIKTILAFTDCP